MIRNTSKNVIKELIYENIRKHELFGQLNLWQDYMQREVLDSLPRGSDHLFREVVKDLLYTGVLEANGSPHFSVTAKGQEEIFCCDQRAQDDLVNKILCYLRGKPLFANSVWKRSERWVFSEQVLNPREKYLLERMVDKMVFQGLFVRTGEGDLRLTKKCEDVMFGRTRMPNLNI